MVFDFESGEDLCSGAYFARAIPVVSVYVGCRGCHRVLIGELLRDACA